MSKVRYIIGITFCLALGLFNSCSTGEYNDLECDPSDYQAECLTQNSYMYCKGGQLISVVCGGSRICMADGNGSVGCQDAAVARPGLSEE